MATPVAARFGSRSEMLDRPQGAGSWKRVCVCHGLDLAERQQQLS